MNILLTQRFARDGNADEFDTRQIKKALNRLGYYMPPETLGITEIPDAEVFTALRNFQQDYGLPVSGVVKPEDETLKALNREIEKTPSGSYLWRTAEDGKVRASHAQYNRTVRSWSDAPDPWEDYNCRCWVETISTSYSSDIRIYDPPITPVYPEQWLLPLLGLGRLYNAWRLWKIAKNTEWTLGKYKSEIRWGNQLKNRDWTPEQITDAIKHGKQYPAPNKISPSNKAIRYEHEGRYIIRDKKTKEILQISGPKFTPNKME